MDHPCFQCMPRCTQFQSDGPWPFTIRPSNLWKDQHYCCYGLLYIIISTYLNLGWHVRKQEYGIYIYVQTLQRAIRVRTISTYPKDIQRGAKCKRYSKDMVSKKIEMATRSRYVLCWDKSKDIRMYAFTYRTQKIQRYQKISELVIRTYSKDTVSIKDPHIEIQMMQYVFKRYNVRKIHRYPNDTYPMRSICYIRT
jgi:hypothetical protein